jgi:DNA-binding transcriptional MocR family regulator
MARPFHSQSASNGPNLDPTAVAPEVAHSLLDWAVRPGPLYQRLADALRAAITRGDLPLGTRLPAERQLAEHLLISRSTVVAAYEMLSSQELVERRQGSGTRVQYRAPQPRGAQPRRGLARSLSRNAFFRRLTDAGAEETIDLVGAYLLTSGGLPASTLAGVEQEVAGLTGGSGYMPLGYPPLRSAIAKYLNARGLPTTIDQVMVTSGAQQAIHLTASLFLEPGDTVVVENPTYPGALDAFATCGARLACVDTARAGPDIDALSDLVGRVSPRLVYLIPTFNNPVGGVMPEQRRRVLARLIDAHQLPTIDDECLASLSLDDDAIPPPIATFADSAPILTVDSVSKLGWAGLRVGWVRAPEELIARLGRIKAVADLGGSLPGQVIATRILENFEEIRRQRRVTLVERFELMSDLLARWLPTWTWEIPRGGLCLWVRLPYGNANDFAQVALRHRVSVVAGPVASADGSFGEYLRLPFGHEPRVLEEGVRRLAAAWKAYEPQHEQRHQTLSVIV